MTRDQIKKIVKLTESIVNKKLNESSTKKTLEGWTPEDTRIIQRSIKKMAPYIDKILEIMRQYDIADWDKSTRHSYWDFRKAIGILDDISGGTVL